MAQTAGSLLVKHIPVAEPVITYQLNEQNAQYVLSTLEHACLGCMSGEFDAVVTGPVHKGVINRSGVPFSTIPNFC